MRHAISFILVLLVTGCVSTHIDTPPSELLNEVQGKTERQSRSSRQWEAVYASVLGELEPAMENTDIGVRRGPMQTWQRICWDAGRPGAEKERRAASNATCAALAHDIPPYTALWLIRQLESMGRGECVPTLEGLLQSTDTQIAEAARRALTNNPSREAGRALLRMLAASTSPAVTVAYLNALRPHTHDDLLPALTPYLSPAQPGVFRACLRTIAAIGTPGAYGAVAEVPDPGEPMLQSALLNARLMCAESMEKNGDERASRNAYDHLYHSDAPEPIRVGALSGLLRTDPGRLPEIIDSVRASGSVRLLATTVEYLKVKAEDPVLVALANDLHTFPGTVQALVLPVLADRHIPTGHSAAMRALEHQDPSIRVAAVRALGTLGDRTTVVTLLDLAASEDSQIRNEVTTALRQLPGADIDAELIHQTEGDKEGRVISAITLISYRRTASAVPRLLQLAEHSSTEVRQEAYRAIGILGTPDTAPAILKLILSASEDEDNAEAGARALVAVCRSVEDDTARTAPICRALETADAARKKTLLKALGKLAGKPAFDAVSAYLDTPDEVLRDAAIRALADWPDDIAVDVLATLAAAAESPIHRVLALRGAVRLLGASSPRPDADRLVILSTLLAKAGRDEDRRTVISGLGTVYREGAIPVLEKCVKEKTLREEAGVALVQVALGISHNNRERAEQAMRTILAMEISNTLKTTTADALKTLEEYDGFITSWLVAGPYTKKIGDTARVDMLYDPETEAGDSTEWRPYVGNADPRGSWQLDLAKVIGGSNRTAYMLNWIRVEENTLALQGNMTALLEMGSDDAIKVWLNGEEILRNNVARPVKRGEEKVQVSLKTGWNPLMLKITQGGGGWGACARLRTVDGDALKGWTYVRNPAQPNQAIADLRNPQLARTARAALALMEKAVRKESPKQAETIRELLNNTNTP